MVFNRTEAANMALRPGIDFMQAWPPFLRERMSCSYVRFGKSAMPLKRSRPLTPENSTSGRGPSARRTIPAPGRTRLRGPANATGRSSRENRWHGHGPASPHIPGMLTPSTTAGSGAPSEEAKRRGPRRLGSRSRRSGKAHDRRRHRGFRASRSA